MEIGLWWIGRVMDAKKTRGFEKLRVYQLSEALSDQIWEIVGTWDYFAKNTVGKQLVRAADSVGANIAEGAGRGSYQDNRRFIRIARGSLNETRHWLRRAHQRSLLNQEHVNTLKPILNQLAPTLNAYLNSIGKNKPPTTTDQPPPTNDE